MLELQEQHDIPGSRGEANFVWKCRLCTVGLCSLLQNSALLLEDGFSRIIAIAIELFQCTF